jgi:hypothetical protein
MCQEPEELIVRRLVQRPQGGSGNNPFLSSNRHAMEYTVLIDPQGLAKKIMTVSQQQTLLLYIHTYNYKDVECLCHTSYVSCEV